MYIQPVRPFLGCESALKGDWQSGFKDSIGRTRCHHKPVMRGKRLDFLNR
jgi:hypothetical protein